MLIISAKFAINDLIAYVFEIKATLVAKVQQYLVLVKTAAVKLLQAVNCLI